MPVATPDAEATTAPETTTPETAAAVEPTFFQAFINTNRASFTQIGQSLLAQLYNADATPIENASPPPYLQVYAQLQLDSLSLYSTLDIETARLAGQPGGLLELIKRMLSTAIIKDVNRFFRGDLIYAAQRRNYLTAIVCMMWALNEQASEQSKVIARGSFKLIDPDGKLFDFLYRYVQFATGQEIPGTVRSNDFAYARDPKLACSSHYKDDREQFGIDIRFQGGDYALPLLPHDHMHILFGRVCIQGKYHTFVKFEEAGLGNVTEFLEHSFNFAKSGTVDVTKTFREKDIPESLRISYQRFCDAIAVEPLKKASLYAMWTHMQQNAVPDNPAAQVALNAFLTEAEQLRLDYIEIRNGQEVIIDMMKFQRFLPAISTLVMRRRELSQMMASPTTVPVPRYMPLFSPGMSPMIRPFASLEIFANLARQSRVNPWIIPPHALANPDQVQLPFVPPLAGQNQAQLALVQTLAGRNQAQLPFVQHTFTAQNQAQVPLVQALAGRNQATPPLAQTTVHLSGSYDDFRLLLARLGQSVQLFQEGHACSNALSVRSDIGLAPTLIALATELEQQRQTGTTFFRVAVTLPTATVLSLQRLFTGEQSTADMQATLLAMQHTSSTITELPVNNAPLAILAASVADASPPLELSPPTQLDQMGAPSRLDQVGVPSQLDQVGVPSQPAVDASSSTELHDQQQAAHKDVPLVVLEADVIPQRDQVSVPSRLAESEEEPDAPKHNPALRAPSPLASMGVPSQLRMSATSQQDQKPAEPETVVVGGASSLPEEMGGPSENKKSKYAVFWIGLASVLSGFLAPISILGLYLYQTQIAKVNKDTPKDWNYWVKAVAFSAAFTFASLLTVFMLPIATLCWLKFSHKKTIATPTTPADNRAPASETPHEDDLLGEYHSLLCECFHLYTRKKTGATHTHSHPTTHPSPMPQ